MDNSTRNEGKQSVVAELVNSASTSQLTLIVMEDAHWSDALTLAYLSVLTKTVADCRALFVVTSRIEGDQLDQRWRGTTDSSPFVSIDLGPLRKQDSIALIDEFMDSSEAITQSYLERAAGNPLFLGQLLRNAQEGTTESLPDSIQSLILARVDRLEPEHRRALQVASVLGQRFDGNVLTQLLGRKEYDAVELIKHNLIREDGNGYLFAQALIQEGIYGSLLKKQKTELHEKAAAAFANKDLILYAEHLGHAGDENAPAAFAAAAREQLQQFRSERALALVNRGLDIAPNSADFELRILQGGILRSLGLTSESIKAYRLASESASTDIERCRAWVGVAEGLRIADDHKSLGKALADAEEVATSHDLSAELAAIYKMRSGVHFFRGELEPGLKAAKAAVKYAETSGSSELEAEALSALADAEYLRGRMISAHRAFDRCIKLAQAHGLGRIVAANLSMRGVTSWYQNDIETAIDDLRAAMELASKTRQLRAESMALGTAAQVAETALLPEGEEWAWRSVDIARQIGSKLFEAHILHGGRIALRMGRRAEGENYVLQALDTIREIESGMSYVGPWTLGALALASIDPSVRREALREGEELLQVGSVSHNYLGFYPDAIEASLDMAEWDEAERYAQALEDYTSAEPVPQSDYYISWGRTLAAFGRGARDEATTDELKRLLDEGERKDLRVVIPRLTEALTAE